jgi:hypothetical protein
MRAELVPYDSKYYGTIVRIFTGDDDEYYDLVIWNNTSSTPSIRQIKYRNEDYTQEDYDNNVEVESYIYQGEYRPIQEEIIPYDSHFETKETLEKALKLIKKINE